ncbi:hypothetical protein [Kineococcus rhizosphaerae]|uniref:Uncharacterized protein n=1 Tax=Kineococcus rhizosphaerae TaxID=559628 RepID=A0A2T0QWR8_9ACTN|nr:hypothetical protein [Kineococcus rhizosphaerae]PRY09919.1 hypothetical protein CLV37_11927 [Kineococcus rhizosphaerae]
MTPHRDSPTTEADEQIEQLFLDNIEVWSTLISSSPTGATSSVGDAVANARRTRARLMRWVAAQSITAAPAPVPASRWRFAGLAAVVS